jgi:2-keto-4-pentenoate hydratase/2-oxohepta-3-ene-1,7-dioic acid hydratase in catechol pathway
MKFISFSIDSEPCYGATTGSTITNLTNKVLGAKTLKELISREGISEAKKYASKNPGNINYSEIEFLPLIPDPGKIICVGLNYHEHVVETNRTIEENPVIFHRFPDSQTAHLQSIQRPQASTHLDYEGELAVIMGDAGSHVKEKDALKHIVGFSCYNDGSVRDWQQHTRQFGMGKNFQKTGSFGPHMVLAEDIPDYKALSLETRLNGRIMQSAKLSQLIFDIPLLISYVSKALPWRAGDVLVTGTPGGVGAKRKPPVFMRQGDKVEIEISDIGILSNQINDEIIQH